MPSLSSALQLPMSLQLLLLQLLRLLQLLLLLLLLVLGCKLLDVECQH